MFNSQVKTKYIGDLVYNLSMTHGKGTVFSLSLLLTSSGSTGTVRLCTSTVYISNKMCVQRLYTRGVYRVPVPVNSQTF